MRDLAALGPDGWEALYAEEREVFVPTGRWRGVTLGRIDHAGARAWRPRFAQWVGFEVLGWGIDFGANRWTFGLPGSSDPPVRLGHFEPRVEPSRWRPTRTVGLHYEVSRLPHRIKRVLYDEVKPLDADTCIGLGGENDGPGVGDHFWFALHRIA